MLMERRESWHGFVAARLFIGSMITFCIDSKYSMTDISTISQAPVNVIDVSYLRTSHIDVESDGSRQSCFPVTSGNI